MHALDKLVAMQGPNRTIILITCGGDWNASYELNRDYNNPNAPELKVRRANYKTPGEAIDALYESLKQIAKGVPEVTPMMLTHQSSEEREFDRQENHQEVNGDVIPEAQNPDYEVPL